MSLIFHQTLFASGLVELPLVVGFLTQFLRHDKKLRYFCNQAGIALLILLLILTFKILLVLPIITETSLIFGILSYKVSKISSLFVLLSSLCVSLAIYYQSQKHSPDFCGHHTAILWWLLGLMNGFFLTDNLLAFFIFFEASLIPLFYWIHSQKNVLARQAAVKMFLYTAAGSALLLVGILYILSTLPVELWQISQLRQAASLSNAPHWLAACFLIGFLIKLPLWPLHSWLPHAHTEAPTSASVLLAAVMLKMGGYGLLCLSIPLFSKAISDFSTALYIASFAGLIPMALIAWVQTDIKRLVAYSSITHMAFVMLALTGATAQGADPALCLQGALMQMLSHGLISAALFFCIGFIYDRYQTRALSFYGGLGKKLPWMTFYMTFFLLANAAVPGLSGFMGELSILYSCFQHAPFLAIVAASSLILGAMVSLRLLTTLFYGNEGHELSQREDIEDCQIYEHHILIILSLMILLLGLCPQIIWSWTQSEARELAALVITHQQGVL